MVRGEDDLPSLCPVQKNGRIASSHCDECKKKRGEVVLPSLGQMQGNAPRGEEELPSLCECKKTQPKGG